MSKKGSKKDKKDGKQKDSSHMSKGYFEKIDSMATGFKEIGRRTEELNKMVEQTAKDRKGKK